MNPSKPTVCSRVPVAVLAHRRGRSACIAGSLLWNRHQLADHSFELARLTAQVTFENDFLPTLVHPKGRRVCARVPDTHPIPTSKSPTAM